MTDFRQFSIRKNLRLRAGIIQAIRGFFIERDYLEVETPYRIPAPAPEAHIDALCSGDWFLHTSPELCMKRLLAAGYPRIFQICKCFRGEERGRKHLGEFTMLEWYRTEADYSDIMEECEELICFAAGQTGFKNTLTYQGEKIDLTRPWQRMSVREAFENFSPMTLNTALCQDRSDEIIACEIEPNLGRGKPLFLYDYPAPLGALARLSHDDASVAERFELYISGLELCNAFSELNDPAEQRTRFEAELSYRRTSGKTVYSMPEKFLRSLEFMPEAGGNALGIDRLLMLFADTGKIDDVTAFTPEEL
ncbi:MAG: EF-P lysine aminoacylase GenX [Desulfobacteraceae bacterium 4572_88]|nr:MAG: EF-P lysine aminoacylase GenX [Desulfobacteraceae bacterium 4572_88]